MGTDFSMHRSHFRTLASYTRCCSPYHRTSLPEHLVEVVKLLERAEVDAVLGS